MINSTFYIEFLRGKFKFIEFSIFISALVTGALTIDGSSHGATTPEDVRLAVLFGIATTLLISASWFCLFKIMCSDVPQVTRNRLLLVSLLLAVLLFFGSTQFNVLAFGADRAFYQYLHDGITAMQDYNVQNYLRNQRLQGLIADLQSANTSIDQAITAEFEEGRFSGANGTGTVHSSLLGIKGKLVKAEETVRDAVNQLPTQQKQSENLLKQMRYIMDSNDKAAIKMDKISALSARLASIQTEMSVSSVASSVVRQLKSLPQETKIVADFSRNSQVKAAQEAALIKLEAYLIETTRPINEALETYIEVPEIPLKTIERISANRAIFVMWQEIPMSWAAAISVDYLPFLIFFLLYISASSRTDAENHVERSLSTVSVKDYLEHQRIRGAIEKHRPNIDDLEQYLNHYPKNHRGKYDGETGDTGDK